MSHKIEKRINKLKHSGNPKFKNLDSDIHYLIKRFEGEKNHKGYFPKFKQGEIVFVDFGINVNKEFSSSHFAIVMNKSDSHTEDILNVVPLSSKENKRYLKIDLDLKWEHIRESLLQLTKIENQLSNYSNTLEGFTSDFNEGNDTFDSFIDKMRFLHEMEHYVNTVNVETNNIKSAIDKTQRLKENSYACINAFQPISKFRIRKLFLPAAATLSVALETLIMAICDKENVKLKSKDATDTMMNYLGERLLQEGKINYRMHERIDVTYSLRNSVSHSNPGEVSKADCQIILSCIKTLIDNHYSK